MCLVYALLLLLVSLLWISERCQRLRIVLRKKLEWNSLISLINESYQVLIVCILINMQNLSFESKGLTIMSSLCILFLFLAISLPLWIITKLAINGDRLEQRSMRQTFGQMYDELNLRRGRSVLIQPSFFLIRRFLLVLAVCVFNEHLIWQIIVMIVQILTQQIIIEGNVFDGIWKKRM